MRATARSRDGRRSSIVPAASAAVELLADDQSSAPESRPRRNGRHARAPHRAGGGPVDGQRDACGVFEAGLLAEPLNPVHDLPRQPLPAELVGRASDRPPPRRRRAHWTSQLGGDLPLHHHVVGLETRAARRRASPPPPRPTRDCRAIRDRAPATAPRRRGSAWRSACREPGSSAWPGAGPAPRPTTSPRRPERSPPGRGARAAPGIDRRRPPRAPPLAAAKRLADAEVPGFPGAPAERGEPPDRLHGRSQLRTRAGSRIGEGGQVHAVAVSARWIQSLANGAAGARSRATVTRHSRSVATARGSASHRAPRTGPARPDVPVGEVVDGEVHDGPDRGRRVVDPRAPGR